MDLADVLVATAAVLVAGWSAWYGRRSALGAQDSARAAEETLQLSKAIVHQGQELLAIERRRDTDEMTREQADAARRRIQLTPYVNIRFTPNRIRYVRLLTYVAVAVVRRWDPLTGIHARLRVENAGERTMDNLRLELPARPQAHWFMAIQITAAPAVSKTEIDIGHLKPGETKTVYVYADRGLTDVLPLTVHVQVEDLQYELTHLVYLRR